MAISTNTINRQGPGGNGQATVNASSADASGGEIVIADPGAGKSIVIEQLEINCAADTTVTIREDTTTIIGPITFKAAAPVPFIYKPTDPLIITANKELQVITGGANAVQVLVDYHILG